MLRMAFLISIMGLAVPAFAGDRVTVDQLENAVTRAHSGSDAQVAKQLSEMELTERLSTARLERMETVLPGKGSRLALIAVADASVFLDLPSSDIAATAPLEPARQQALLAKTDGYARKTISEFPDFFATQQTIQFADGPVKRSHGNHFNGRRLHFVAESSATVRFLAGKEEVEPVASQRNPRAPAEKHLIVEGVFGPIYRVVLKDVLTVGPTWSHWEQSAGGPVAVFNYKVPEERSHYVVQSSGNPLLLPSVTAYRGEIALDPGSGAILRLTLMAMPRLTSPTSRGDIMIEYGPVEFGGNPYICPLKSVALSLSRDLDIFQDAYGVSRPLEQPVQSTLQLRLNDVSYAQYHLFRTDTRILPGDNSGEDSPPPSPNSATPAAPATPPNY